MKLATIMLIALLGLIAPVKGMLIGASVLCGLDLITGLLAAWKQKVPIVSSKLRRTVVKMLVYEVAILAAFITQKWLMEDSLPVASWSAGVVGLVELKSIIENLNIISGQDVFKALLDRLTMASAKSEEPRGPAGQN